MRKPNKIIPKFENHARFFKYIKINQETDCWEWAGYAAGRYGRFNLKSPKGWLPFQAHRVSWSIFKGELTPGLVLDHKCRNKICVNVDHLREVTDQVNTTQNSESFVAYNLYKTHCPQGHEYTIENTRVSSRNGRYCLTCKREKIRSYRLRNKCK